MWTRATRGRLAAIERKTKRYPTDLTDEEWGQIAPLLPAPPKRGRKPRVDLREVLNAIRYMTRTAGGWRMLPKDFPPWQTVYWRFRRFVRLMLFRTIHDIALMMDRERAGREASPSAGVVDSQTVKAPAPGAKRGYDAAKKTVGRKRHVTVDTDGRLLMVNLTPADISDSAGAQMILDAIRKRWPVAQAPVRRRRLRQDAAHGQGRLLRLRHRGRPPHRQRARLQSAAAPMGRRAQLRMAHPLAPAGALLRAARRCFRSHHPRRHGKPALAQDYSLNPFSNGLSAPFVSTACLSASSPYGELGACENTSDK